MTVKENHPTLLKKLQSVFAGPSLYEAEFDTAVARNMGHGREEVRSLSCTYDLPRHFTGFAGVRQIFRADGDAPGRLLPVVRQIARSHGRGPRRGGRLTFPC